MHPKASIPIGRLSTLADKLNQCGIDFQETDGISMPLAAQMHDRGAVIPALVVSPRSEWGVSQTLKALKTLDLYRQMPVSVRSGGYGYFNGASCSGVMLNLAHMTRQRIEDNTLILEPGCILGQIVDSLASHRKAVPHGDCFGVGAGGHFLTAGWDLILARRYGLGCQAVTGGRIVLWDGTVAEIDDQSHPELLYAMRGGAGADAGVITEIRLRLIEEPSLATWRFTSLTKPQLETCISHQTFFRAATLPRDISVSFRFHFESDQIEPVCSFNVVSLLSAKETIRILYDHLGDEVTSLVADPSTWNQKSLLDLRLIPASDFLATNPGMLAEMSATALHENPEVYWQKASSRREMASSFFTSISHWIIPECDSMLLELYEAFQSVRSRRERDRMYALIIQGGGRMLELQDQCSMPLGQSLARFELHWDDPVKDEVWCRHYTDNISNILQKKADTSPGRPYRGDIWRHEQCKDVKLDAICEEYDRRLDKGTSLVNSHILDSLMENTTMEDKLNAEK